MNIEEHIRNWANIINESNEMTENKRLFGAVIGLCENELNISPSAKNTFHVISSFGELREEFTKNIKEILKNEINDKWRVCNVLFLSPDENSRKRIEQEVEKISTITTSFDVFTDKLYSIAYDYMSANDSSLGYNIIKKKGMTLEIDDFITKMEKIVGKTKKCEVFQNEKGQWRFKDIASGDIYGPSPSFLSWNSYTDAYRAAERGGYTDIDIIR